MAETTTINPHRVAAWHDAHDNAKLDALVASMNTNGWNGAPIVVITDGDADPQAITGSHRIAAARETGTDIPAIELADILNQHGANLADLIAEYEDCGLTTEDATYEVIVRLPDYLPADVCEQYGLDAH